MTKDGAWRMGSLGCYKQTSCKHKNIKCKDCDHHFSEYAPLDDEKLDSPDRMEP